MQNTPLMPSLQPVTLSTATPPQHTLLEGALQQMGFIPNMYANMVHAPALLSTYLHGYKQFRAESGFSPTEQEVVLLAVSLVNECQYCVAAHSMVADKVSGMPAHILAAIRAGQPIEDLRLAVLFALTQDVVVSRGRPQPKRVAAFIQMGFTEQQLLYIVLAVAVKAMSNFTNHFLNTELDAVFQPYKLAS